MAVKKEDPRPKGEPRPDWLGSPAAQRRPKRWQVRYAWHLRILFQALIWGITVGIGRQAWDWGQTRKFSWHSDKWFEKRPDLDGGADKLGHMISMYMMTRGQTYLYDELGGPHWTSVLLSSLTATAVGVVIEVGDAYTARYGFSYTDIVFNEIGVVLGMLQDIFPVLNDVYSLSIWWFPSRNFFSSRNEHKTDFLTDYTGTKHFLHLHLAAIPYFRKTFLKYVRLDFSFWTRNFKTYDSGYPDNLQQWLYFGVSLDLSRIVRDHWPKKWYRTSTSVVLKYINLWAPFETGFKFQI